MEMNTIEMETEREKERKKGKERKREREEVYSHLLIIIAMGWLAEKF